jgi:hypothetical protein
LSDSHSDSRTIHASADPADLKGPGSPEAQAWNTGPVNAGGTTGMGQPRASGPQRALPGDAQDRTVVKAAAWTDVHDAKGNLVAIVKSKDVLTEKMIGMKLDQFVRRPGAAREFVYVCDSAGRRLGVTQRPNLLPVSR